MAITIVAPPAGARIGRGDDLQVFVTADTPALKRAVLLLEFPGLGVTEEVHDGSQFKAPYLGSRQAPYSAVSGAGFQYVVRRDGGWPDGPTVRCIAYDTAGGDQIL